MRLNRRGKAAYSDIGQGVRAVFDFVGIDGMTGEASGRWYSEKNSSELRRILQAVKPGLRTRKLSDSKIVALFNQTLKTFQASVRCKTLNVDGKLVKHYSAAIPPGKLRMWLKEEAGRNSSVITANPTPVEV